MVEEESGWVFDSLVCFLNGPVWSAPLESFIEENSLIFEPNVRENGEYRKIFNDYKNLVDFMLGNFMEDIGITPQQFENACARGSHGGISLQFDQTIFEQIWAANDYEMFKRMMTQRNVELQLQALELIEKKYGITPKVFVPDREEPHTSRSKTPEVTSSKNFEKEIFKEIVEEFDSTLDDKDDIKENVQMLLEEKYILEEKLKQTLIDEKEERSIQTSAVVNEPKLQPEISLTNDTSKETSKPSVKPSESKPVGTLEMKKRQEYLRAQRDKLVTLKKEARKKHLQVDDSSVETKQKTRERPKSAKQAAESFLEGNKITLQPQELALRKALVAKLKSEVISNNDE